MRDHRSRNFVALLLRIVFRLWLAQIIVFLLFISLPETAIVQLGWFAVDPAAIAEARRRLGQEGNQFDRYLRFSVQLMRGDLGTTALSHESVAKVLLKRAMISIPLFLGAVILVGLSFLAGCFFPVRSAFKKVTVFVSSLVAIPSFVVGVAFSSFWVLWLAPRIPGDSTVMRSSLTILSLGLLPSTLSFMLAVDGARGWSQSGFAVAGQALALSPSQRRSQLLLSVAHEKGPQVCLLLGTIPIGLAFVEPLFGFFGLGSLLMNAIRQNDFAVIQGVVLVAAFMSIIVGSAFQRR
jgi:peptide/nickel transport system permease protein